MAEIKMDAAHIEEMAELTKALLKLRRAKSDTTRDVAEIDEAKLVRLKNRLEDAVHDTMDKVMPWEAAEK